MDSMNRETFQSIRCVRNRRSVTVAVSPAAPWTDRVIFAMGQAGIFWEPTKRSRSIFFTVNG